MRKTRFGREAPSSTNGALTRELLTDLPNSGSVSPGKAKSPHRREGPKSTKSYPKSIDSGRARLNFGSDEPNLEEVLSYSDSPITKPHTDKNDSNRVRQISIIARQIGIKNSEVEDRLLTRAVSPANTLNRGSDGRKSTELRSRKRGPCVEEIGYRREGSHPR